jgi:hypothetical protein
MNLLKSMVPLLVVGMLFNGANAKRLNVLYIGNSLTGGTIEGAERMANKDSTRTGISVATYGIERGATAISTHWTLQSGFTQLDNPVVHKPANEMDSEQVDNYDYLILQTYTQNGASPEAESLGLVHYCDLALSKGVTPIIFAAWIDPTHFDFNRRYVNVYKNYKSRGALFAPLADAHAIIDSVKPVTYLYISGDPWHHINATGCLLTMVIFNYLFDQTLPSKYNVALLPGIYPELGLDPALPEMPYLAAKAEQALAMYYTLGPTGVSEASRAKEQIKPAFAFRTAVSGQGLLIGTPAGIHPAGSYLLNGGMVRRSATSLRNSIERCGLKQ